MSASDLSPKSINSSFGRQDGSIAGSEAEAEIVLLRTQMYQGNNGTGLSSAGNSSSLRDFKDSALESGALLGSQGEQPKAKPVTYWSGFLTIPIYVAYAILLKLQSHLRSHLFISSSTLASTYEYPNAAEGNSTGNWSLSSSSSAVDEGERILKENGAASEAAYLFGLCVSFYYVGCFIFRIGHNVLLGWKLNVSPRSRVVVGYCGMSLALTLIVVLFYGVFNSETVGWTSTPQAIHDHPEVLLVVLFCYLLAGCSLATFEPNVLSTLTAHGPKDKVLAIGAIPLATNSVACTALFALGLAHTTGTVERVEITVYSVGAAICILGALVYWFKIPKIDFEASQDDAKKFWSLLKRWREWFPAMKWLCLAAFLDEITLSMSLGLGQYIYGVDKVPLLAPFVAVDSPDQHFLHHDYFLVLFFFCGFLGGTISRFLTYDFKLRSPLIYLGINAMGIFCILSKTPLIAPVGMFCIMYGNGCVYASIARTIDEEVGLEFNLAAYSFWLCCADLGGFTGANAVVPIHASLGSVGHGGPF